MINFFKAWSQAPLRSRLFSMLWLTTGLFFIYLELLLLPTIRATIFSAEINDFFLLVEDMYADFLPKYLLQYLRWFTAVEFIFKGLTFILLAYFFIRPSVNLYSFFEILIFLMILTITLQGTLWIYYLSSLPQSINVLSQEIIVDIRTFPWPSVIWRFADSYIIPAVFWLWLQERRRKTAAEL